MTLALSQRAKLAAGAQVKEPNIVLEIEGVSTLFGAVIIQTDLLIGDDDFIIGEAESDDPGGDIPLIGGLDEIDDQNNAITMDGTTTQIQQTLQIDLGQGGSISNMSIALLDGDGRITELITPGLVIDDILQARCKVYLGFADVAWPEDYIVIFRGVVSDVLSDAGKVVLTLNHPDDKKQGSIYKKAQPKLVGAYGATETFLQLDLVTDLLERVLGPDGTYDASYESCLVIENEVVKYLDVVEASTFTATVSIANPAVFTAAAHGLLTDQQVTLTTTGALPTGLAVGTTYFVVSPAANTFELALTAGGPGIVTTGTQSGVHTVSVLAGVSNVTRGHLFTTAAAHADQANAYSMTRLMGNCIDLALKLMASTGTGDKYLTALEATSFVDVDGLPVANALYFNDIDVVDKYNVQVGDFITSTGASTGANNVALKEIIDIVETDTGSYLVVDGVTFVSETGTAAIVSFRSQYDTLPDGLALINDEIDFDEHLRLQSLFLSLFEYDFRLKDTINDTRQFIEQEVYSPVACFSLPRKSRCSVGYHIGPIPGQDIKIFDATNIKNPNQVRLQRTTNRNFYNEIVYEYDEDNITQDKFNSATITLSELSKAQIKGTNKPLIIKSKGLRSILSGFSIAQSQSNRRLKRYQYAAELLKLQVLFADGFNAEIGDIVWVDGSLLKIPDIKTGLKGMAGRYFFVQNKTINIKTGDVSLDLLDTNFSGTGRYGLISPSSIILTPLSTTEFVIQPSFSQKHGTAEHKKWTGLVNAVVRVRSADFSSLALTTLVDVSSNTITVSPALPWVPDAGMIMELPKYTEQTLEAANLVYVSMSDTDFPDGKKQFLML